MSWAPLQNPPPARVNGTPPYGVRLAFCLSPPAGGRKTDSGWVKIQIGQMVAERANLTLAEHKVNVLIGDGDDAGKVGVVWDQAKGLFKARRQQNRSYVVALPASASRRFQHGFETFITETIVWILKGGGQPILTFRIPDGVLAEEG